jgi:hypothetical protein
VRYIVIAAIFVGVWWLIAKIGLAHAESEIAANIPPPKKQHEQATQQQQQDQAAEKEYADSSEYPSKAGEGITYIPFDGDVPFQ